MPDAEDEAQADAAMGEAEEDQARLDDSYVSAQLQRASLSDGAVDGLPDEDMVLAEGGLTAEAARELRRDVEVRVKAASEGALQLDTSDQSIQYGQEVKSLTKPLHQLQVVLQQRLLITVLHLFALVA